MCELINGDCLVKMRDIDKNSVDLLFCDLPYCGVDNKKAETSCKWNTPIDLDEFWREVNRICKINCPMFFTCSTKFGVSLINSNPKNFRYDLVWVKSSSCGFLNAKKMPMKKHEMVYVFYRKLPFYDLSSHTHKFITKKDSYENDGDHIYRNDYTKIRYKNEDGTVNQELNNKRYEPELPTSVLRTDAGCSSLYGTENKKVFFYDGKGKCRNTEPRYDPPLPDSVIDNSKKDKIKILPVPQLVGCEGKVIRKIPENYITPLPNTILEIKSEKGRHPTQKPLGLMRWILKYYSKEGDTILDPTMGSGSMGVACKEMGRKFIGIELDQKIFGNALKRLN